MDNERGTVRSARAGVHRRAAPAVAGPCGDLRSADPARSEPGPPRSRRPAGEPPGPRPAWPWIPMYHSVQARESRRLLEEVVGGPVTGFCYPYGAVDPPAARAVHEAGYDHACAIAHSPLTGRLALPRSYVGERDGAWRLRAKEVRHRPRGTVTELRRTTARRAAG
ncbi:polysaccharide deacetylase family protein [Kitasatospora sp. NPDC004745]|uniref:polysaccharide deacetylase family protein n=1 Tax=Kitasatospora sp. NPDC004745 TaxID=3364019 RepID=UPI003684A07A